MYIYCVDIYNVCLCRIKTHNLFKTKNIFLLLRSFQNKISNCKQKCK